MHCYTDEVGIKTACGGSTPSASGLFLNDLPGATSGLIRAAVKDWQADYIQAYEELVESSFEGFVSEVETAACNSHYFPANIEYAKSELDFNNLSLLPAETRLRGFKLRGLKVAGGQYRLKNITLFSGTASPGVTVNVAMWSKSIALLTPLASQTVPVAIGPKTYQLDLVFDVPAGYNIDLFIYIDTGGLSLYSSNVCCYHCADSLCVESGYFDSAGPYAFLENDSANVFGFRLDSETMATKFVCENKKIFLRCWMLWLILCLIDDVAVNPAYVELMANRREELTALQQSYVNMFNKALINAIRQANTGESVRELTTNYAVYGV